MSEKDNNQLAEATVAKIKELVKEGNVSRIIVKHGENKILNIPLNAGIVGTVLGLSVAPWAMITTAIATIGFDCKVELIKTNGETVEILSREVGKKAVDSSVSLVNKVKDVIDVVKKD